jgi:hypothetical protein
MATTFSFKLSDSSPKKTLTLRHNPYNVAWNYNVNTHVQDTYTGQVIQILSVNVDRITIDGRFGIEGAFGKKVVNGRIIDRSESEQFEYTGKYPGLHAMTEFFREYFAVSTQGSDDEISGHFAQIPMTVSYGVDTHPTSRLWPQIIPVSFPSFRRSNEDFAPEWRVEAYVVEADATIPTLAKNKVLERLRQGIGYKVGNPFSDPLLNNADVLAFQDKVIGGFREMLPDFNQQELQELIWNQVTVPNYTGAASINIPGDNNSDYVPGEVDAKDNFNKR